MISKQEQDALNKRVGRNINREIEALKGQFVPGSQFGERYSKEWLALEIGVNTSYLSDLCHGKKGVKLATLLKIKDALGVSIESLLR